MAGLAVNDARSRQQAPAARVGARVARGAAPGPAAVRLRAGLQFGPAWALASGGYSRTTRRVAVFCSIATIHLSRSVGRDRLGEAAHQQHGDAPGRHTFRVAGQGRRGCGAARLAAAVALLIVGGALVQFWWPGLAVCLLAWAYGHPPHQVTPALWTCALASLYGIGRNPWALAALPLIFAVGNVRLRVPRGRLGYSLYYPAHLAVLWGLARLLLRDSQRLPPGNLIKKQPAENDPQAQVAAC